MVKAQNSAPTCQREKKHGPDPTTSEMIMFTIR
jgi:hypothetical protein